MLFIFTFVQGQPEMGVVTKNKMNNPRFVDEETVPLVQDEDYDNFGTPNTSTVDETLFIEPDTTEATSTLNQKVKRDKLAALYRHLNVTGNLNLIDLD